MSTREVDDLGAHWSYAELWDAFPIPSRPDSEELAHEEKYLTRLRPENVSLMILGSTIEYRSLCKRLGIRPHVIDFSRDNFDSLSSYSKKNLPMKRLSSRTGLQSVTKIHLILFWDTAHSMSFVTIKC